MIYSTSLASHPNPVWSCADLIDQVWGYDNLSPNLLPFYLYTVLNWNEFDR
ncbi:MAG: helix-turn-helix domain-containing protein [Microcystis aeruginosa W13-18]|nr:helix-turn-helix domain-containing protein [Microcystis aeruginosa W13-18]NCR38321.1 helix-turn-helix domain-containing protein [Microcystis aeruginosa S11-05]NCR51827.1 helix-turn-helix domain-containing protein [Microcystis aeruginosa S11-01]NCS50817.1 helix-turn-helix domain-containing protein [Microcystis aeruginosa BK11-02]NCS80075.1 helix-turn-helix domain-containing protein [Microcystis aeruginosa K13-07]